MTPEGLMGFAAAFSVALATIAPAIAQGKIASKAMESIARQPEAAGDIRTSLVISLAFTEALAIYALLIGFLLLAKI